MSAHQGKIRSETGPEPEARCGGIRVHRRQFCKALDHVDVRELGDALAFAEKRGKPLNTTITVHPKLLACYPGDVGRWISEVFLNRLRIWCGGALAITPSWVRGNQEGDRREHLHVLLCVPERERANLADTLRQWLVGEEGVVKVGRAEYSRDRYGRRTNKAFTYMLKQMNNNARFALGNQVRREKKCRDDHAPVAAILGKRCGVSRSLNERTRATFWDSAPNRKTARRSAPQGR